ncbi:MAG TPA: hypothetical protein VKT72_14760 [Candidatus Baltobacteraceae bacterium]|nr:hypothetical protein [Candidatus Baltobacteraceae bacterium]
MLRKVSALVLCVALPLPAAAQSHVIAQLGNAPLVGQVASTSQLQNDLRSRRAVFEAAGTGLGLTPAEFAQFAQRIADRQVAYVTIPRHLNAMSWRSGDRVRVLHDVIVPAGTHGWEVDLVEQNEILALFIPNKCGNLSLLRRPTPALAAQMQAKVASANVTPTLPPPMPSPAPVIATPMPAPAATPAPYASLASSTGSAPATHSAHLWPLLLLPVIAFFAMHGHSGPVSLTPAAPVPVGVSAPTPPPAGCPTPKPQ